MSHSSRLLTVVLLLVGITACARGPLVGKPVPVAAPTRPLAELEQALQSTETGVRAEAAWEIASARAVSEETGERLQQLAASDPDMNVRSAAVWALLHVGRSRADGGGYDEAPRLIRQPSLVYPQDAFDHKVQGKVEVEILIDEAGKVARAEVRFSIPQLDQAALDNVRLWMFSPARKNGKPVATTAVAPVTFRIY